MPNRLEQSESPYLRQHADNPVDWWPWCDEAFAEARRRDVPVLVSIGYSTCHWCHVMAHESFEDEATAAAMNAAFVCIKVDREEHPEVDEIYMDAVQALTGHGGWPLNAFTDHQGRPFYALTYLPRERWGQLCGELARLFREDRPRIHQVATDVAAHLVQRPPTPGSLDETVWEALDGALAATWDGEHPGFAHGAQRAPKFPSSQLLPLLLASGRAEWIQLAEATLEAMQDAGLHDRVGGGFHRYSVTRDWRLPHFEKMLYDNALLIGAYAVAGRQLGRADFLRTAVNAGDYLLRDLRVTVDGVFRGYASAEDADDPAGEGSFYAWSPDDLRAALGTEAEALITDWAIVAGEREVGPHGHLDPVLTHIPQPRAAGIVGGDADIQHRRASWERHLPVLRAIRDRRPRPGRDDKVLTDLNGLALEAFAALARHAEPSDRPRFAEAARELVTVVIARHGGDGLERLPGKAAYITDYGHLASGLTAAYAALGDPALVDAAIAVVDEAAARLRAPDGGFYTTPAGRDDLFRRSRELVDNAYPAGQNALAVALVRLAGITGDARFVEIADGIIATSADIARRAPSATTTLLAAWRGRRRGPRTAVITGSADQALAEAIRAATDPDLLIVDAATAGDRTWTCLEGRRGLAPSQVLVCLGERCLAPWTSAGMVAEGLATVLPWE